MSVSKRSTNPTTKPSPATTTPAPPPSSARSASNSPSRSPLPNPEGRPTTLNLPPRNPFRYHYPFPLHSNPWKSLRNPPSSLLQSAPIRAIRGSSGFPLLPPPPPTASPAHRPQTKNSFCQSCPMLPSPCHPSCPFFFLPPLDPLSRTLSPPALAPRRTPRVK